MAAKTLPTNSSSKSVVYTEGRKPRGLPHDEFCITDAVGCETHIGMESRPGKGLGATDTDLLAIVQYRLLGLVGTKYGSPEVDNALTCVASALGWLNKHAEQPKFLTQYPHA